MGYNKILIPLDGSTLAEMALEHITTIASPNAHIHLVSIVSHEPISEIAALGTLSGQGWRSASSSPDQSEEYFAREAYLKQVAARFEECGYVVTVEVQYGDPVSMIASVIADGFDIVVMATHGRTGLSKLIMGSVAEGVLRRSHCPILIIPALVAPAK